MLPKLNEQQVLEEKAQLEKERADLISKQALLDQITKTDFYSLAAGTRNDNKEAENAIRTDFEKDYLSGMPRSDLVQKYGESAVSAFQIGLGQGENQYINDKYRNRYLSQFLSDTVNLAGNTIASSALNLGALGAQALGPSIGKQASERVKHFSDSFEETYTDASRGHERAKLALDERTERYNKLKEQEQLRKNQELYNQEVKDDGETLASLNKFGRDTLAGATRIAKDASNTIKNIVDDPNILWSRGVSAGASVGASIGISRLVDKGINSLSKFMAPKVASTYNKELIAEAQEINKALNAGKNAGLTKQQILSNVLSEETGRTLVGGYKEKALKFGDEAFGLAKELRKNPKLIDKILETPSNTSGMSWMLTSGLMEGSGSGIDIQNQINEASFETLEKNSNKFVELRNQYLKEGDSLDTANNKARSQIAYTAGLKVARDVGILAAGAGYFSRGLEKLNKGVTRNEALSNIAGETAEEGLTGLGTIFENREIKKSIDKNKDILEGVGKNVGESMVGAVLGTAAIQSPFLASKGVQKTTQDISTAKNKVIEAYKSSAIPEKIKSKLNNKDANQELANVSKTLFNNLSNKETVDTLNNDFKEAIVNNEVLGSLSKDSKEISKAVESLTIPEEDVKSEGYSSNNAIVEYQNAVSELASLLKDDPEGEHNKTKSAALKVIDLHNRLENFDNLDQINEAISKLPDDDPNKEKLLKASEAIHTLTNNDALQSVYNYSNSVLTNITGSLQENFERKM